MSKRFVPFSFRTLPSVSFLITATLLGGLGLMSCSHSPKLTTIQDQNNEAVYVPPPAHAFQDPSPDHITFAVVGMNDFHGSLLPRERKLPNGKLVQSGGAPALASMLRTLKTEMQGRILIVDGGDQWQGTLESNQVQGATVVQFYNQLGVRAAAIGNHEFDFGLPSLQKRFQEAHFPYVASNIENKKTHQPPAWKNVHPSALVEVEGYRFGVIGFSTTETPGKTRYENVKDLNFNSPVKPVIREAKKLRKQGANAVMVTAHAGTICVGADEVRLGLRDWKLHDATTAETQCDENDEIARLAHDLPKGTLDGIVAGHTHQIIHHWLSGVPVIEDESYNQFFNILYFTFDRHTHKLLPELTRIEGLVPICTEFFEGTSHCDVKRLPAGKSPKLVPASFHGARTVADAQTLEWLKPIVASTEKYRHQELAVSELPLTHLRELENGLGNLLSDSLRKEGSADFGLVNNGGIRVSIDPGQVTFDALYRAIPFDNLLNVIKLKGKDVKLLFQIATSGSRGLPGFSGVHVKMLPFAQAGEKRDLNGDGKFEAWEVNRLVELTRADGSPILDQQWYTVATLDYLVTGGDDLRWFMQRLKRKDIDLSHAQYCRDILANYLTSAKVINTAEKPLVDEKHPRVEFVK